MKILALEASAAAASAAVTDGDRVVGEYFLHTGKTHSQTLLPMTEQLLAASDTALGDLDLLAVTSGPGSFTGLRIAIAAVKGLAMGADKPCLGVSTLEGLAYNLRGFQGIAAAVMDARCGQVYCALFDLSGGGVDRICEDQAIAVEELKKLLGEQKKNIFLVGDGADLCYTNLLESFPDIRLAPPHLRLQRAASVAAAALAHFRQGGAADCGALLPGYLRLPQAERELNQRNQAADRSL